ncbi:TPA: hypothetical protein DDW35_02575 [Candidatus Sumerlaeota bacterium]|nr:hypothetical protein [Candidatus Sumerlaeota bacterium]
MRDKATKFIILGVTLIIFVFIIASSGALVEYLDAGQMMIIQSPISGELKADFEPGVYWQGFGRVTKYPKRSQFWFSAKNDQGKRDDESIKVRFNDGGHGNISGSVSWSMPLDKTKFIAIHTAYGSSLAVEQQLVRTTIEKAVYMSGPMMSSSESAAEKRNDLLRFIEDQIQKGVYLTVTQEDKQVDPLTNQTKTVNIVKIRLDSKTNEPLRAEESPLEIMGIKVYNLSINSVIYEKQIEDQIAQQQQAKMAVQIAIAKAKEAEQKAITTAKEGEAEAAKAEWKQKALMAEATTKADQEKKVAETRAAQDKNVAETKASQDKSVAETKATQELRVAELETSASFQTKQKLILEGTGMAEREKLIMEANGNLEKKLAAWVEVNKAYADAIGKHQGNWVPTVTMGGAATGGATAATNGAADLVNLMMVKTAADIGLTLDPSKATGTAAQPQKTK